MPPPCKKIHSERAIFNILGAMLKAEPNTRAKDIAEIAGYASGGYFHEVQFSMRRLGLIERVGGNRGDRLTEKGRIAYALYISKMNAANRRKMK